VVATKVYRRGPLQGRSLAPPRSYSAVFLMYAKSTSTLTLYIRNYETDNTHRCTAIPPAVLAHLDRGYGADRTSALRSSRKFVYQVFSEVGTAPVLSPAGFLCSTTTRSSMLVRKKSARSWRPPFPYFLKNKRI
jgi:hypothetical protein